jgi:uncharacterized membrane protein
MAQLAVLGVDNRDDVERRFDLVANLAKQELLQLQDAAYAYRDDTIKQIAGQLEQGRAAVFLLARSATVDKVIEAIKPYNPTVIQTNLTHDREEELVRALQS